MPDAVRDVLLSHPGDESFHAKVRELYEQSHIAPVTDLYGYNPPENDLVPVPVRDVMIALTVQHLTGDGEFSIELTDGAANYTAVFDLGRHQVRLYAGEHPDPVSQDDLPRDFGTAATDVEMSLFDRQVLVAINGEPVLSPWTFDTPAEHPRPEVPGPLRRPKPQRRSRPPRALPRRVLHRHPREHGVQRPYKLEGDELFVLGDNSPVSHDSRRWPDGAVPGSLLVGKPFVVHLPSKPGRLRIGILCGGGSPIRAGSRSPS